MIVEGEVVVQPCFQGWYGGVLFQVDVLVFDRAPQAFDKDVVQRTPPAVHAYSHAGCFQARGKGMSGELCALVGVEYLRLSLAQGLLQRLQAETTIQGVRELPGDDIAAPSANR